MAEKCLTDSQFTGLNWDIHKNTICIKTFKKIHLRKDDRELKLEFLDENRRRCQLSLSNFKRLCDLKNVITKMASLIQNAETASSNREPTNIVEQTVSHAKLFES